METLTLTNDPTFQLFEPEESPKIKGLLSILKNNKQ